MKTQYPGVVQKFIHRFLMIRPVSAFLSIVLHRADAAALKLTNGRRTVAEIVGLPIIQLTTTGAKTGRSRTNPLVSLFDGEKIALIASNFGKKHHPGWYYNLMAHPFCTVHYRGRTAEFRARLTEGEEREKYWRLALDYYRGYEAYRVRAAPHRVIPIVVLEPL
jgi:deazaflavin-dependent oxidoreductase (nitroreductase family)